MASSSGKRTSSSGRTRKSTTSSRNRQAQRSAQDSELFHEIGLIVLFVAMLILFCCNFGIIGPVGNAISGVLFGIFGFTAYIAPIVIFLAVAFWFANEGNPTAVRKMIAGVVLFLMIGVVCDLITKTAGSMEQYDIKLLYTNCSTGKKRRRYSGRQYLLSVVTLSGDRRNSAGSAFVFIDQSDPGNGAILLKQYA